MKPIPKSLHTVTVLVTMSRLLSPSEPAKGVLDVLKSLGYTDTPDTYELVRQALKQLNK